ncbi:MAG: hypothetical protein HRT61_14105, partial [Ekhidna sp.]|nr:hypothetical protein [Ekhidna sp.]
MKKSRPPYHKMHLKNAKRLIFQTLAVLFLTVFLSPAKAQMTVASANTDLQPKESKKAIKEAPPSIQKDAESVYVSESERVYVNKDLPIYLKFSTSPDGEVYSLKSEQHPEDTEPFYLDTEGANYIRSKWAIDSETKEYAMPMREIQMELYADSKSPLVSPKISASNKYRSGAETYYGADMQINLDTWDAQSGVKNSFWSVNNEAWKAGTSTFNSRPSGKYSYTYYAVDNVNNYSEPSEISFVYDKTAPKTSLQKTELGTYVFGPKTSLTFQVEEEHSGLQKTYFKLDGMESQAVTKGQVVPYSTKDGPYTMEYYSVDNVANNEDLKKQEIYFDKIAPTSELLASPSFDSNSILFVSGTSEISFESTDNKAGVKETTFTTRGFRKEQFADPISLENFHGITSITYFSEDKVNNVEATQYQKMFVDTLRPSSTLKFVGDYFEVAGRYYLNEDTKIKLTGSDLNSGVAKVEYGGIGADFKTYENEFSLTKEGHFGMMYRAIDNVDNVEYSNSV